MEKFSFLTWMMTVERSERRCFLTLTLLVKYVSKNATIIKEKVIN